MSIVITGYEALCNLGNNINSIYEKALAGDASCFEDLTGYLKDTTVHAGIIHCELPQIYEPDYNIRNNRLILKTLDLLKEKINSLLDKYSPDKIGVIAATTNSGVEEYEKSHNPAHFELGNSASFLHKHLNLKGFYTTVSTACSSGIKAFSLARDLINNNISDAVIIACVDSFTKLPVFGFHSLEVLSDKPSLPFSKNRKGMNIGEACAIFVVEKDTQGIEIRGLGESSDIYHPTTPDPQAKEVIKAISTALTDAMLTEPVLLPTILWKPLRFPPFWGIKRLSVLQNLSPATVLVPQQESKPHSAANCLMTLKVCFIQIFMTEYMMPTCRR